MNRDNLKATSAKQKIEKGVERHCSVRDGPLAIVPMPKPAWETSDKNEKRLELPGLHVEGPDGNASIGPSEKADLQKEPPVSKRGNRKELRNASFRNQSSTEHGSCQVSEYSPSSFKMFAVGDPCGGGRIRSSRSISTTLPPSHWLSVALAKDRSGSGKGSHRLQDPFVEGQSH
jgi:hypothetical protein